MCPGLTHRRSKKREKSLTIFKVNFPDCLQLLVRLYEVIMWLAYYSCPVLLYYIYCYPSFLQFTFDKDGKVIDATLPIVTGFERKRLSSGRFPSHQTHSALKSFQTFSII